MKLLLLLTFFFLCTSVSATDYYISASGNDTNTGLSTSTPWKTIAKVNSSNFLAGDRILFHCGDIWRETLTILSSGSAGSPITFGAYGSGANPVIDGSDIVSNWTPDNANVETGGVFVSGFENEVDAFTTEFDSKTVNGGNTVIVSTANANHGTKSALLTYNGTSKTAWFASTFTPLATAYYRFYFYIPSDFSLDTNAGIMTLSEIWNKGWGPHFMVYLEADAGSRTSFHISAFRQRPTNTRVYTGNNGSVSKGAWHYIEIEWARSTTVGGWQLWIDGTSTGSDFTLNTQTYNNLDQIVIGDRGSGVGIPTNGSKIYFDDVKISSSHVGAFSANEIANVYNSILSAPTDQVFRDGVRAIEGSSKATLDEHEWFSEGNTLSYRDDSGSPQGAAYTIEASVRNANIQIAKNWVGANYITISGFKLTKANFNALDWPASSTNTVVTGCDINYAYMNGVSSIAGAGAINVLVTLNNISWNGACGVNVIGLSHDWEVSNNNVFRNCQYADGIGQHNWNAGIHTWCEDGSILKLKIVHNVIYENGKLPNDTWIAGIRGCGIHMDSPTATNYSDGNFIAYNRIYDNNYMGIHLERTTYQTVAYNLVYNHADSYGITLTQWDGAIDKQVSYNRIYNNTCYGNLTGIIVLGAGSTSSDVCIGNNVKNNICFGNTWPYQFVAGFGGQNDGRMGYENEYLYNCFGPEKNGVIQWDKVAKTYADMETSYGSSTHSVQMDPLFVDAPSGNFHLQSTSPCINKGVNVELTNDFEGNTINAQPDIGAYEFYLLPTPIYKSSAIENTTPSLLEMTYDINLANIVPATSAFTVLVNSAERAVNAVAISGTKVQLTLASAIAFGDVVTIAYTKPAVSPLQTTSIGMAASVTAKAVTNNISAPVPAYVSAAVGNAAPSLIEMTYNLGLANIVPATSAFSVLVNSAARVVNAVAISGTKVQLTLASAIAFGDVVTVAYTKPALNPLQTNSVGLAASVTAQAVTNNISAPVPVYASAIVGNTTPSLVEMTYNLSLANIVSATSAFSVLVNAAARAVSTVAISGTKVQLTLASSITFGDVVTVAYTKPAVSPLQTTSARQAESIIAQTVTNNVSAPVPSYVSAAVGNTTPSLVEMTYNLSLANIVPATSAFTVLVNSAARAVNAVAISGTKVQLTLASPIAFGDVITVAYTKPVASPLQTTSAGQAASVTSQAVTNNISAPVPVYVSAAVGNATPSLIEITYDLSLANIVPATSAFTVLVNSAARAVNAVAISGTKVQLTLANAIAFGDLVTVDYTRPALSPLQTTSAGQAASITAQAVTNNISAPVPVYASAAVRNTTPSLIEMTYNLSLANIVPATSAFTVFVNSAARAVNTVAISGTKVQITLASPIAFGDVVTVAYTKPSVSPLQTTSAGQVLSISAQTVINNISAPVSVYVSAAVGNTAPSLVEMTYNLSLANIVPATSAFTVLVNSAPRTVSAVVISGTKVQLTLANAIAYGDVVTIAYTKPALNPLQTNSAGLAASLTAQTVTNSTNPTSINGSHFVPVWQGENGTNHMNLIVVSATLENLPLSVDDEIAVFSGSICVGSKKLTTSINAVFNNTFLAIPASQDDGSNNGFINNDSIIFKIWDHTNQREMGTNVVNYKNDIPTWITNGKYSAGGTSVVEIATFTENIQTIALLQGYNLISTYISPDDPNVSTVAKQLMDQGELIKVQDETGNSFENWGSLGGWINKIGSFESTEGYKIKVANNCTLRVTGRPIVLPLDIPLKSGWNIISFPRTDLVDAMDIIQSLIDQNKLMKVQDEVGNSIENWGIFGGWKNAIGNFIPGKAYKVKSNADAVITIHENYLKSATIPFTAAKAEYFLTKIEGNGTDHMNINIVGLQEAGLSIGDELAAFDGDVCVGSLKITKNNMIDGTAGLVASASSDAQKPDGFKEGSIIRIVGWNKLTNKEFQVQPELLNGQLNYQKEASVLIRMKSLTPDTKIIDDRIKTEVYPNPCNGNFTVRLSAIPETGGRIEILDISGRNILSRGILETAEEFNLDHQQPGIYIVKTIIGSTQTNHKLIIY